MIAAVRAGLAATLHDVFIAAMVASLLAFVASFFLNDVPIRRTQRGGQQASETAPAFGG